MNPRTTNRPLRRYAVTGLALAALAGGSALVAGPARAAAPGPPGSDATGGTAATGPADTGAALGHQPTCPPQGWALGFSDALDKQQALGAEVGGLSALAHDTRRHRYAAIEDHSGDDPTRMWFLKRLAGSGDPVVSGTLLLRQPDGTAYTGADFDAEGLAVLPGGRYVVSSEVEPSIRVFGRDGVQRAELPVPDRFRVAPAGQATANATLEGLTDSRNGNRIYAAMEGTLSGDISASGDDSYRRFLVYDHAHHGYRLAKQVGYRVDPGMRIAEVQRYGQDSLLVLEAAWTPEAGNSVRLYAVTHVRRAADVSAVPDLGDDPSGVMHKRLVTDVTRCPDLGAKAKEPQANPLMDNYEAMAITHLRRHADLRHPGERLVEVILLSDDNFSDVQTTRVLRLAVRLP